MDDKQMQAIARQLVANIGGTKHIAKAFMDIINDPTASRVVKLKLIEAFKRLEEKSCGGD